MLGQRLDMPSTSRLRSTIGVQDAPGNVTAVGDSVVQGVDCDERLHPCVNRVPDSPPEEHILKRVHAKLSFKRAMFRDGAQRHRTGRVSDEVPLHQILCTGVPAFLPSPRISFLPNRENHPLIKQVRHAVCLAITPPPASTP